jgi:hypothetical protein
MPEGCPRHFGAMTHCITVRCDSDQPGADRIMSSRWQAVCSLIDSFATLDLARRVSSNEIERRHRVSLDETVAAMAQTRRT